MRFGVAVEVAKSRCGVVSVWSRRHLDTVGSPVRQPFRDDGPCSPERSGLGRGFPGRSAASALGPAPI